MPNPIYIGTGLAPDVAVVDGIVYVAYGTRPDALKLVALTPDGTEIRRQSFAEGFFNSFPRFGGPWLGYKRNHDWKAAAVHVQTGQSWVFPTGQADGNFGLCVNADLGVVAYQWTNAYQVWLGSLLDGQSRPTKMTGAPDGLSELTPLGIVLRKDIRTSVPGMLNPVNRGDLTVGERPEGGIAVQLGRDVRRVALGGQDTPTPSCATDGHTYAMVTGGPQGVRLWLGSRADVQALPTADSLEIAIPRINGPLWLAGFDFGNGTEPFPGNCTLQVVQGAPRLILTDLTGKPILAYVAGTPDGDMDAVDRAVQASKAINNLPVAAYWTAAGQASGRLPKGCEIVAVEGYQHVDETLQRFESRMDSVCSLCWTTGQFVILVAQSYTSNTNNTKDLRPLIPVYARQAIKNALVRGIFLFNIGRRSSADVYGWDFHSEIRPAWRSLAAGLTGTPPYPAAFDPRPAPRPIPLPTPTPQPAPKPVAAPFVTVHAFTLGGSMQTERGGLRGPQGKFLRVIPGTQGQGMWPDSFKLACDQDGSSGEAEWEATQLEGDDAGRFSLKNIATGQFWGGDAGKFSTDACHQYYTAPSVRGALEKPYGVTLPTGQQILFCVHDEGNVTAPLTWVKA